MSQQDLDGAMWCSPIQEQARAFAITENHGASFAIARSPDRATLRLLDRALAQSRERGRDVPDRERMCASKRAIFAQYVLDLAQIEAQKL
jgi:hypothetical protein